nr:hypothetical protein [Marinicella sp. W31]MDC2879966.1 hypothetical protein [Marinicella sp. W31]
MRNSKSTEEVALGIRRRVFEHSIRNNGGYLSQACSAGEQLAWLYNEELNLGAPTLPMVPKPFEGVPSAQNPDYHTGAGYNGPAKPEFDRLFIAPAHYALVAYATLIEVGRMAPEGLSMFNKDGSSVEMIGAEHSPGMEVHNGTLGIGLSTAAGLAYGRRRRATPAAPGSSCPTARCRRGKPGRRFRPRPIMASTISTRSWTSTTSNATAR